MVSILANLTARLAQSVEHETLNLRVVGSSPTLGDPFLLPLYDITFAKRFWKFIMNQSIHICRLQVLFDFCLPYQWSCLV